MEVQTHNTWDVGRAVVIFNETNNDGEDEATTVGRHNMLCSGNDKLNSIKVLNSVQQLYQ